MPEWTFLLPGVLTAFGVLALASDAHDGRAAQRAAGWARAWFRSAVRVDVALAAAVGIPPGLAATLQVAAALGAGLAAWLAGGLPVLAVACAGAAAAAVRLGLRLRANRRVKRRQDAVLDAVRMLRGLLESGGTGVQEALTALARKGPAPLRAEFAAIVAASRTGRQPEAWAEARERVADPLFDLLSAALAVHRPSGGSLAPLFADLEESVASIHEVAREAEALQVQARSAAGLVVLLPIAFLLALSAFRSPYLDAYRSTTGAAFLGAMLGTIGLSYLWILRWLRIPEEPRLEVA